MASGTAGSAGSEEDRRASRSVWPFIPVTVLLPTLGAAVGVDGGLIFQVLAVENLGLSPVVIGLAFGLGVVSLPVQILAARMPLRLARSNMQWFLRFFALELVVLAVLVGIGSSATAVVVTVVAIAVLAEVAVSVLYAPAWQPLLQVHAEPRQRQQLNTRWPAAARALLAIVLLVVAGVGLGGRVALLIGLGVATLAAAWGLSRLESIGAKTSGHDPVGPETAAAPLARSLRLLFVVIGVVNLGALPLWLVYVEEVVWPEVNLGVLGAAQTAASMAALLAWRPVDGPVLGRAGIALGVNAASILAVVLIDTPVGTLGPQAVIVLATFTATAAATTLRIALLETAHRLVTPGTSVRAFTMLDVVASTSLQVGLLIAGVLIAWSATSAAVTPYELLLVATVAVGGLALARLRSVDRATTAGKPSTP